MKFPPSHIVFRQVRVSPNTAAAGEDYHGVIYHGLQLLAKPYPWLPYLSPIRGCKNIIAHCPKHSEAVSKVLCRNKLLSNCMLMKLENTILDCKSGLPRAGRGLRQRLLPPVERFRWPPVSRINLRFLAGTLRLNYLALLDSFKSFLIFFR